MIALISFEDPGLSKWEILLGWMSVPCQDFVGSCVTNSPRQQNFLSSFPSSPSVTTEMMVSEPADCKAGHSYFSESGEEGDRNKLNDQLISL